MLPGPSTDEVFLKVTMGDTTVWGSPQGWPTVKNLGRAGNAGTHSQKVLLWSQGEKKVVFLSLGWKHPTHPPPEFPAYDAAFPDSGGRIETFPSLVMARDASRTQVCVEILWYSRELRKLCPSICSAELSLPGAVPGPSH